MTNFHVSNYLGGDASQLLLRVWYDRQDKPAIDMPLMDFVGDIQAAAKPYHTIYFSRVRASHNFRLPMPFEKHIRIEVRNPTDRYLMGYMEVQWDEVKALPNDSGYLRVVYRQGTFKFPHQDLMLCNIQSPGTIVAHFLQLEGDHPSCANGEGICEANHEIYLDGDKKPTCESLGCEDFYGHSWGFKGVEIGLLLRHRPLRNNAPRRNPRRNGPYPRDRQDHFQEVLRGPPNLQARPG